MAMSKAIKSGSRGFGAGEWIVARKLLATGDAQAPSPGLSNYVCRDVKSGAVVHCQNPQTLLIIVAGMSCMMLLVTVAMLLLCWSVARQRRLDTTRLPGDHSAPDHRLTGTAPPPNLAVSTTPAVAANSPEYDDAVFVQLPGDEKPQFFALPTPFLTSSKDSPKPPDVASDDVQAEAKDTQVAISSTNNTADGTSADPCLQQVSSDGLYRNPLFSSH